MKVLFQRNKAPNSSLVSCQVYKYQLTYIYLRYESLEQLLLFLPALTSPSPTDFSFNLTVLPGSSAGEKSACKAGHPGSTAGSPWVGKIPWRRDRLPTPVFLGFPGGSDGKESTCNAGGPGFDPWVGKIPWRRTWQSTPVLLTEESPQTEKPGGVHVVTKSQTQLSN